MKESFPIIVDVEDNFSEELQVFAVPPIGATLNIRGRGTFKVKEVEFRGSTEEPLKIMLRAVPILSF